MGKIKKILISTSVAMAIGATASGIYYDNAKELWMNGQIKYIQELLLKELI